MHFMHSKYYICMYIDVVTRIPFGQQVKKVHYIGT